MSKNLPQPIPASSSGAPSRFTAAGKLERRTLQDANVIAASTYLRILEKEGEGAIARTVLGEAVDLETTLIAGVGKVAATATAVANSGGPLAERLVAEVLGGSRARLEAITTRESNNLR